MVDPSLTAQPSSAPEKIAKNLNEAKSMDNSTTTPSLHSIYQATLDSLIVISTGRRDPQIAHSASRLQVWGAGLFKMSIPLDDVFESDKDSHRPLRKCILGVLVEILVWEQQELDILASETESKERSSSYQQHAQATTALLATDELKDLALDSRATELEGQAMDDVSPTGPKTGDLVPDLIQILFDLLPALRAARQSYCIDLEEETRRPPG